VGRIWLCGSNGRCPKNRVPDIYVAAPHSKPGYPPERHPKETTKSMASNVLKKEKKYRVLHVDSLESIQTHEVAVTLPVIGVR